MNTTQSGRSMLEMLAVLVVIGVLTVGVLLGYRQAMIRYKTYRTYVEVSEVVDAVFRVCDFWASIDDCNTDVKSHVIEGGVITGTALNPFGHAYTFAVGKSTAQTLKTTVDSDDICQELKNEDWPSGVHSASCSDNELTLQLCNKTHPC